MDERRRITSLILIMTLIAMIVGGISITLLYRAALAEGRARLVETAQSQARLLEAITRFDTIHVRDYPGGPTEGTLSQIRDAHGQYEGFGETGEFTLARFEDGQIIFLLKHRHNDLDLPLPIPFDSDLAEPMRLALSRQSGTVIGLDYRGVQVLAAHEPVAELDLGIVAKIDMAEIRAPFVRAGILTGAVTVGLVILGALLFLRISNPLLEQLRDKEEKYRTLFERDTDGIFIYDPDTTNILDANEATSKMYGYHKDELIGMSCLKFSAEVEESVSALEKIRKNGEVNVPIRYHQKKDGTVFPVDISGYAIKLGGNNVMFAISKDIAEKIQAEKALRESESHFRSMIDDVIDISAAGIFILDENFYVVWVNQTLEKFFGLQRNKIIGKDKRKLIRDQIKDGFEDPKAFAETVLATYDNNTYVKKFECQILRNSEREERWLEHRSRPIRLGAYAGGRVELYYDITERKRVEEVLSQHAGELSTIFATQSDVIIVYDLEMNVRRTNPAFLELFGFDPVGLNLKEIIQGVACQRLDGQPLEVVDEFADLPTPLALRGEKVTNMPFRVTRADGIEAIVETNSNPMIVEGSIVGSVAVWHDITERKLAEEALLESNRKLKTILAHAPLVLSAVDLDGVFILSEGKGLEKLGRKPGEFVGVSARSLYEKEKPEILEYIRKAMTGEAVNATVELTGEVFDVIYEPICDETGKIEGVVAVSTIITERQRAEQKLREAHDTLEERVEQRTMELEKETEEHRLLFDLMVGREIRMADLKIVIKKLRSQLIQAEMEPIADDPLNAWME
jgi:PAS domain S-box-containing protein